MLGAELFLMGHGYCFKNEADDAEFLINTDDFVECSIGTQPCLMSGMMWLS